MSIIEWIAAITGVISVVLTARVHLWAWPIGIVNVLLYFWIFWNERLYSDALLQVYFLAMSIYGWWHWLRRGSQTDARQDALPVQWLPTRRMFGMLLLTLLAALGWGAIMARWTDADFPILDAIIAMFSVLAQFWMARKLLQAWPVWIAVDVLAVGVYSAKGMVPTTILYALFLLLAIGGWWQWRARYRLAQG
ncbi:nicotinamide riboside transporter PnuC [Tuwongella immobilis]|uniref:Nicotinamide riboside transporter PnuC n=1 Tax=Tuwongella immobilis TaxID=692036 RepID=A0A6C2YGV2_9BACT|nr:nicotinamide riboside transporter PnuC [Tuwongella immobilis]VIP00738.1 aminotransferase : Nicotinamide mononucleotide transporter PnuC OS=Pseudomonas sp. GM21 GN=PMI22_06007 PE=4 SV=1: NMN_transporter [Tuwongella immobilis]VTR96894.1 aminotransferase : Nicotinamide mononucleotide transporter PnuC OS=Pseudomonas sp. GM21 GN=PMI22_06007 PE=4 SV=1: NMN_transporter [Tuwongella immobilis]